jgi:superfamily I DNA and RNA helicase
LLKVAVGIDESTSRFITTEPIGKDGEQSEEEVWKAIRGAFSKRDCIGYWRYPIFSKTGETRKEPDILIVDKELGILIIEVKSITIDQIVAVNGHRWEFKNFYMASGSPYQQAENQLYAILGYCDREEDIRRQVIGRAIVALPAITEKQWQEKGFDRLPSCPPIIFKNHLGATTLLEQIQQAAVVVHGKNLNDDQWELLLAVIGGTTVLRKPPRQTEEIATNGKTRSSILNIMRERLHELDLQQAHIGSEIPPGAQRIRGIAGSGKTVLLCQKAAHMYLKHPDWDIALVFFTRALYSQIEELIDKWMRHFSCGDVGYKNNLQAQSKLRILHAWGAKSRQGFYRTVCQKYRLTPLTVNDTDYKQPNKGLADVCKRLLEQVEIEPMFDAVLIDEGQDLVVDEHELNYEDKQVFYWLAYKSLRLCDPENPAHRRLIWAYDEAQSLHALIIPEYKEVFGQKLASLLTRGSVYYKGGIKKNEVMQRCYRTPGPILTAAHAIAMGLLRPEGMFLGITYARDWRKIGYEVKGDFRRKNQQITLHRPPENSPNPIPQLWNEPVIRLEIYNSRQEELVALAQHIKHNLSYDKLLPSREILVVVLGSTHEAIDLETHVASFLIEQNINIFVPSATKLNQLNPQFPDNNPDTFWYPGGVTVSRIHRAKGNEADMVYVVGFDNVAKCESDITLRNQLFVALTRARGWARLSGVGNYPMYDEMRRVIESGDTFSFIYKKEPLRDMGSEEVSPTVAVDWIEDKFF